MSSGHDELGDVPKGAVAGDKRGAAKPPRREATARSWIGTAAANVPTAWLTAAAVGVFLAATAAFGGLATAEAGSTSLRAGETHVGPMVSLTITRAVLIDDFADGGASAEAADGERVLVLVVDAENVSRQPVPTLTSTFGEVVRPEVLAEVAPTGVARLDDGTIGAVLQPGVPAELVLSWVVPADAFHEGDDVRVALFDHELRVGQSVLFGEYWADGPELAAVVTVVLDDVGSGADAAPEEQP